MNETIQQFESILLSLPRTGEESQQRVDVLNRLADRLDVSNPQRAQELRLEAEILALKNAELAQVKSELRTLSENMEKANLQKSRLLQQVSQQAKLLQQQNREDGLTGLYNRRYLDEQLWLEYERAKRYGHPLCVVMIDIDLFKQINDRYSHAVGDEVLKAFATILQGICRRTDFAARYGGDEFALFLPETKLEDGRRVCERIRERVAAYPWSQVHPELQITLSIGLAGNHGAADHEAILRAADERLYQAKGEGRDRLCM